MNMFSTHCKEKLHGIGVAFSIWVSCFQTLLNKEHLIVCGEEARNYLAGTRESVLPVFRATGKVFANKPLIQHMLNYLHCRMNILQYRFAKVKF